MTSVVSVKPWLAQQIANIHSVQKCVLDQHESGADIVVHSWRGVLVHVHLIDEAPKLRNLKRMAQEATRIGVGSLFIVNVNLLWSDGTRILPPDWLLAIHALTDEKIYTYRVDADGPHIGQVHLKNTPKGEEHDLWYGPDVQIGQLPFYRIWVKLPSMKGDYLVANFASEIFWRNPDYRNARARSEQRYQERKQQYTQYEYGYGGSGPAEAIPKSLTRLEQSYAELGLRPGASCDEVKSAFRKLALAVHPDVSALPKQEAETKFRALNDAYNYIRDIKRCS